jgi:hypothetical protein
MKQSKSKLVICSSAAFYRHVNKLAEELEFAGYEVIVPHTAKKMRESGNYDTASYKTWYDNPDDFGRKTELVRRHFDEVAAGDMVLVVNDEKHGIKGYIGPNVLMEMGLAFYLRKPIYVLYGIDAEMPVYEEVLGMNSAFLGGDISRIAAHKA